MDTLGPWGCLQGIAFCPLFPFMQESSQYKGTWKSPHFKLELGAGASAVAVVTEFRRETRFCIAFHVTDFTCSHG